MAGIDLLKAINKVSDVVHNRPRPLREFDQIYMKTGDLVTRSDAVAGWAHGKRLAFIGDGDAVSVERIGYAVRQQTAAFCVSHLKHASQRPAQLAA